MGRYEVTVGEFRRFVKSPQRLLCCKRTLSANIQFLCYNWLTKIVVMASTWQDILVGLGSSYFGSQFRRYPPFHERLQVFHHQHKLLSVFFRFVE
jgi:formylglycine-generating enzyme required for sulfatase activity